MNNYFVCEDISSAVCSTNHKLDSIVGEIKKSNIKPYFIYAYAVFESTITEIIRYYLKAFPYKIDNNITVNKEVLINKSRTKDVLSVMIEQNIRRYSCKPLYEYLQFFLSIQDIEVLLEEKKIKSFSNIRNSIVHDDIKNTLIEKHKNCLDKKECEKTLQECKEYIRYVKDFFVRYEMCMRKKYSDYTLDRIARTIWNNTFSTPLLYFDEIWEYQNKKYLRIKDVKDLRKRVKSLSSSESLMLRFFLQQYSIEIDSYICDKSRIAAIRGLDTESKNKLIKLIDFFEDYPVIFCGEHIE